MSLRTTQSAEPLARLFIFRPCKRRILDIFVFLPDSSGPLVTLAPVYDALKAQGGVIEGEYVRFGKWPVQILTDANALIAEAIREAAETDFDGVPTRVFSAEHLCAIALQTGRSQGFARVMLFLEENEVDLGALSALAARFGLSDRLTRVLNSAKGKSK